MQTYRTTLKVFAFFVFVFAFATMAEAQATRTWVSGVGDDVNPCSRTAPCKTFAGAISKTATNGEINCLDPAGFGTINITKSITIDCEDTQGSILASGVTGVIVNITNAADVKKAVKLRGLSINGAGSTLAASGVRILAASSVHLDEVVIDGFQTHGISIETTSGTPRVFVQDTHIRSVNGNAINTFISGGTVSLVVGGSQLGAASVGLNLASNTSATITDSQIAGHTSGTATGIVAANSSSVAVVRCTISNNTTGVSSLGGGTVRLFGSMVTGNGTGLSAGGGSIVSHTSNVFAGNGVDGAPTSTVVLQ
ncbi:MAG TPA: hypothetical protein VNA22_01310 [Pyrinomonadaceae bacterium]|nr:hypothetical protein [Pyrinomonadaceae bacterium]